MQYTDVHALQPQCEHDENKLLGLPLTLRYISISISISIIVIVIINNHFLCAHCKKNIRASQMSAVNTKVKP